MKIVIPGEPISKKRHKCGCAHNRKPFVYDPQIKEDMLGVKAQMHKLFKDARESDDTEIKLEASRIFKAGSFHVGFRFLFPADSSASLEPKSGKILPKLWGFCHYNHKPDFDNLEKFYADCMTGIFWHDDAQIVSSESIKLYSNNPRTEITIMPLPEYNIHPKVEAVLKVFGRDKLQSFVHDVQAFKHCEQTLANLETIEDTPFKISYINRLLTDLAEFAGKYSADLKKIEKYKDLGFELQALDLGLASLENGEFKMLSL